MEKENKTKVYIVRYGEVALKGGNKPYFEKMLVDRIRRKFRGLKDVKVRREEGMLVIRTGQDLSEDQVVGPVSKIFGVESISPAMEVKSDIKAIEQGAVEYTKAILEKSPKKTFKVQAKRGDKSFPMESPDLARHIGGCILKNVENLKVDVHEPDLRITIHVKMGSTFIYEQKISGFGGLPLGTNGKGMVLLSGGIDSPAAAFLMAKRGMYIDAVHFHSYPFTSQRAHEKVKDLAKILTTYCGSIALYSVNLLKIQEEIGTKCPDEELTLITRRFMMKIAERIAKESEALMLITGENLGQVASQTAEALVVTDEASDMPVMRPLIGMDKSEIIDLAKEIETYETSIQPFEDCCTVFLPKHPKTKPRLSDIKNSESLLDVESLISEAIDNMEFEMIK